MRVSPNLNLNIKTGDSSGSLIAYPFRTCVFAPGLSGVRVVHCVQLHVFMFVRCYTEIVSNRRKNTMVNQTKKMKENHWSKTIHSTIEQHETHCNLGVNSGPPEGQAVSSPLVLPVM